jgi:hypothetical protein
MLVLHENGRGEAHTLAGATDEAGNVGDVQVGRVLRRGVPAQPIK